jgi:hypothetical protein
VFEGEDVVERDEGEVADEGGDDCNGERSEEGVGEEEGGGFEELEEIDWLSIIVTTVEPCVNVKLRNALDNTEKRGGNPQELDDLVHETFSRAKHKKDVETENQLGF